ncbi:MAG: tetratricopeptide repeat protein [Pirellulales bacterium]|nr:tetratricopeptide repeat protein [Pirellulales bacterium]
MFCASAAVALLLLLAYGGFLVWFRMATDNALARAQRQLGQGKPAEARGSLEWLLAIDPGQEEAVLLAGKCLQAEQQWNAAAEMFGRIGVDSPRHQEASLSQAITYVHDSRIEAAEDALLKHLERYPYPGSQAAHEELRWIYFNLMRRRELEQYLKASLEQHPADFSLLFHFLYSEFRPQVAEEALGYLRQINEKRPGQASVLLALGYGQYRTGDGTAAWQQIRKALELRPAHLETRLAAAEILLEQGQAESAETIVSPSEGEFSSLVQRFRSDDRWWRQKSRLAELRGDRAQALECLEKALALRPFEREYVFHRSVLLQAQGREGEAAESREDAKRLEESENQLRLIVLSGELEHPTRKLCLQVADNYEKRGMKLQAGGWRRVAGQFP